MRWRTKKSNLICDKHLKGLFFNKWTKKFYCSKCSDEKFPMSPLIATFFQEKLKKECKVYSIWNESDSMEMKIEIAL